MIDNDVLFKIDKRLQEEVFYPLLRVLDNGISLCDLRGAACLKIKVTNKLRYNNNVYFISYHNYDPEVSDKKLEEYSMGYLTDVDEIINNIISMIKIEIKYGSFMRVINHWSDCKMVLFQDNIYEFRATNTAFIDSSRHLGYDSSSSIWVPRKEVDIDSEIEGIYNLYSLSKDRWSHKVFYISDIIKELEEINA